MTATKSKPGQLRRNRRDRQHSCWDHLVVAPLWVAYDANLGTLLRTCDAVGACLAVPATPHYREALRIGDTLGRRRPCIHWTRTKERWVEEQRLRGSRIVAVELAEGATPLPAFSPRGSALSCYSVTSITACLRTCWTRSMNAWRSRWSASGQASTSRWRAAWCCTAWRDSPDSVSRAG